MAAETRVCRVCGEAKPLTAFVWHSLALSYRYRCKACEAPLHHQAYLRRKAGLFSPRHAEKDQTIPDSDPYLDLDIINACWNKCCQAGQPAIRRMVERIAKVCWGLRHPGAGKLNAAAIAYCEGYGDLAIVGQMLGEYLASARAVAS